MRRTLASLALGTVVVLASPWAAGQSLVVPMGQTLKISGSRTYELADIQGILELEGDTTITVTWGQTHLPEPGVFALTLGKFSQIVSTPAAAAAGRSGTDGVYPGGSGTVGETGKKGADAYSITFVVHGDVKWLGTYVHLIGGKGGAGGAGGDGAKGADVPFSSVPTEINGGDGGAAADGAAGGDGGRGGNFRLVVFGDVNPGIDVDPASEVWTQGGEGGRGGDAGWGGSGGGANSWGGAPNLGSGGNATPPGRAGRGGTGGEGGRVEIRARGIARAFGAGSGGGRGGDGGNGGHGGLNGSAGGRSCDNGDPECQVCGSNGGGLSQGTPGGDGGPGGAGGDVSLFVACSAEGGGWGLSSVGGRGGNAGVRSGDSSQGIIKISDQSCGQVVPGLPGIRGGSGAPGGAGGTVRATAAGFINGTVNSRGGKGGNGGSGGRFSCLSQAPLTDCEAPGPGGAGGNGATGGLAVVSAAIRSYWWAPDLAGGEGGGGGAAYWEPGTPVPEIAPAGQPGSAGSLSEPVLPADGWVVAKSVDKTAAAPGEPLRYTIRVATGEVSQQGVTLRDPLPAKTRFVAASDGGALVGGEVLWSFATLSSCEAMEVALDVEIEDDAVAGTLVTNAASATSLLHPGGTASNDVTTTVQHVDPERWQNKLGDGEDVPYVGDPVQPSIGNLVVVRPLFRLEGKGGPLVFRVIYNGRDAGTDGPLGFGWTHPFNVVLTLGPPNSEARVRWGDGRVDFWKEKADGSYAPIGSRTPFTLRKRAAGGHEALGPDGTVHVFDASGRLVSVTDQNGLVTSLAWSTALDTVTDPSGRVVSLRYAGGRLASVGGPLVGGSSPSFEYDGLGNLNGIVDTGGQRWSYAYDAAHRMTTETNPLGRAVSTNAYDAEGRVISQRDADGGTTAFSYSAEADGGTTVTITPPAGAAVSHRYDRMGSLVGIVDGLGYGAVFRTDEEGRRTAAVDKSGRSLGFAYDAGGRLVSSTNRLGASIGATRDPASGRPNRVTSPLGLATSLSWDGKGNPTRLVSPGGATTTIAYGASGLPSGIVDSRGKSWSVAHDAAGLLASVTDPVGGATTLAYDAMGRPVSAAYPDGSGSARLSWDAAGHVLSRTDPVGHETLFAYDAAGQLESITEPDVPRTTRFAWTGTGRLARVTDALGGETRLSWDAVGNLASVTDPDGVTVTYAYDRANRLVEARGAEGQRTSFGRDVNGEVVSVTNALGATWGRTLDAEGRVVEAVDPLGGRQVAAVDADGRLTAVTDALGRVRTFAYDAAGRPGEVTEPGGGTVGFVRDAAGNVQVVSDPLGRLWQFTWDDRGLVESSLDPLGRRSRIERDLSGRVVRQTLRGGEVVDLAWDAAGRLAGIDHPGGGWIRFTRDSTGNPTRLQDDAGTVILAWDVLGRRTSLTDGRGRALGFEWTAAGRLARVTSPGERSVSYAYDRSERINRVTDGAGRVTRLTWDIANRLTRVDLPNGTSKLFTWDAADRRTAIVHQRADGSVIRAFRMTYDALGRIASEEATPPPAAPALPSQRVATYDSANRALSVVVGGVATTYAFDPNGNLLSKTKGSVETTYAWDPLGRLTRVVGPEGSTELVWDAFGRAVGRRRGSDSRWTLRDVTRTWAEYDGAGANLSTLVWADDVLLYEEDATGSIQVFHEDGRGSVVAVTDAGGNEARGAEYGPLGSVVGSTGTGSPRRGFLGTRGVTTEDGIVLMGARAYDPELGRFLSEDPLGLSAGPNAYAYVGGDPVNRIDPAGTTDCPGGASGSPFGPYWENRFPVQMALELYSSPLRSPDAKLKWKSSIDAYLDNLPRPGDARSLSGVTPSSFVSQVNAFNLGLTKGSVAIDLTSRLLSALQPTPLLNVIAKNTAVDLDLLAKSRIFGSVSNVKGAVQGLDVSNAGFTGLAVAGSLVVAGDTVSRWRQGEATGGDVWHDTVGGVGGAAIGFVPGYGTLISAGITATDLATQDIFAYCWYSAYGVPPPESSGTKAVIEGTREGAKGYGEFHILR